MLAPDVLLLHWELHLARSALTPARKARGAGASSAGRSPRLFPRLLLSRVLPGLRGARARRALGKDRAARRRRELGRCGGCKCCTATAGEANQP